MSKTIDVEGGTLGPTPSGRSPIRPRGGGAKIPPLAAVATAVFGVLAIVGIALGASGKLGVTSIDSEEVAVVVNYVTGSQTIVNTPGYQVYIPFLQDVFKFDKRTQDFVMEGQKFVSSNHVPQLTVREKNGSNFRIDNLHIQYEIIPSDAGLVLHDSGPGDAFKEEWIKGHARSILRNEFGKFDAIQAADPTVYKEAPQLATDVLNELLEPHGIRILQIITPNPRFDDKYEDAIETRKNADQDAERLTAQLKQLEQEQLRQLEDVAREKSVAMKTLIGELNTARREAETRATKIKGDADAYAIERGAEAEAMQRQLLAQAVGLEQKYRKEAEGILARTTALEKRGEVVVREAIIKKLLAIQFTLMPYSRDASPTRLEHSGDPVEREREVVPSAIGGGL
jgi:regulator of protease activity HflC (stomatin/prohibitin superfamily)